MQVMEVTFGERLTIVLDRATHGQRWTITDLFNRVGDVLGEAANSVGNLRRLTDPPTNGRRIARVYALLTFLGENPEAWGIDLAQLPASVDRDAVERAAQEWLALTPR
jgi:hypothetical protein